MSSPLHRRMSDSGAVWDPVSGRPLHFGDPAAELDAARTRCVLADRSDLGRLLAAGPDFLNLLHRLSTADVVSLAAGRGRPAVLTTPKGRIVQRIFVHHLGDAGVLAVSGPGAASRVKAHIDHFTFSEDTGVVDVTATWSHLALLGPSARETAEAAGLPVPEGHGAASATIEGVQVHVLGGDGLSVEGLSIAAPTDGADRVWESLSSTAQEAGGRLAADAAVQAWRVLRGLPENGFELTEEHNPLEAGLWDAVSFDKGCYVGQEVVARLNTYDKVARDLRGFVLPSGAPAPARGTPVLSGARQVGEVTSALIPPGWLAPVAVAYVKRDSSRAGTELTVGTGEDAPTLPVRELPFGPNA